MVFKELCVKPDYLIGSGCTNQRLVVFICPRSWGARPLHVSPLLPHEGRGRRAGLFSAAEFDPPK